MAAVLEGKEVSRHNTPNDCWIVIANRVYDVTSFLPEHPGGKGIILKYAGKDATKAYLEVHTPETAEQLLPPSSFKGMVDVDTLPSITPEDGKHQTQNANKQSHISLCINVDDFTPPAIPKLSKAAIAYLSSGADTLTSLKNNLGDWQRITFRPRVLKNVLKVSTANTMQGYKTACPFFIAPTGLMGIINPEAESQLVQGAVRSGIHYCISGVSTKPHKDMMSLFKTEKQRLIEPLSDPTFFFQLYVNSKKEKTIQIIKNARDLGFKALMITVDTPVVGKREAASRHRAQEELEGGFEEYDATPEGSEDQPVRPGSDPGGALSKTLCWEDLKWMKELFGGPIVLKGIQCAEDANIAVGMGVDGIYLSNHGGRQLDYAPSSLRTLLEIKMLYPEILHKCEFYMDGGVRRGTDVVKALCLGATAVGIGRPFVYAMAAYGTQGVLKAIEILKTEVEVAMKLIGATSVEELHPGLINTAELERKIVSRSRL
ncbi:mitochondrial cytochrome-like protein b2 [Xylogone sp. PMI_703]|nr:mitochondrial cytochrome-like protein b2 [Xylogone sp. PMI_703]